MRIIEVLAIWALALFALAAMITPLFCWWVDRECDKAEKLKRERRRNRAPVIHVGDSGTLNGWRFYIKPGVSYWSGPDPLSGEIRFLGYSEAELAEIAQRREEFEQPELEWLCRDE